MNNIFLWNQTTRFVEKGRPNGPENLREGERINTLYAKEEKQLLAQAAVLVGAQQDKGAMPHVPKHNPR